MKLQTIFGLLTIATGLLGGSFYSSSGSEALLRSADRTRHFFTANITRSDRNCLH